MSSHHFVKEGQEPALLIVDAVSFDRAAPLLEWVPTVIVLEEALQDVLHWAIKVDVVIGKKSDLDLLTDLLVEQAPVKLLPYDHSQDAMTTALDFILTAHQNGVNILACPTDELFRKLEGYAHLGISVITEDMKWSLCTTIFQKWFPSNHKLWIKETQPQQSLQLEGLQDLGDQFETKADGFIQVHSVARFWVGEAL